MIISLLALTIFIIVIAYVFPLVNSSIRDTAINNVSSSASALNSEDSLVTRLDGVFVTVFVGLALSVLVTSFFIESSPILIPIYIISLGILVSFSAVVQYMFSSLASNVTLASTISNKPMISFLMGHMIFISIGVGVLSMILMFAKPRGSSGGSF